MNTDTPSPAHDPRSLPGGLPAPRDDGACLHLPRTRLPSITLSATHGRPTDLADLCRAAPSNNGQPTRTPRGVVLFFYPRTGVPGQPPSLGFKGETWESIPGARGCTPQSCGFRDLHAEFSSLGVAVLGVSTNTTEHQREFKERNHVPFEFLSDHELKLTHALRLPTFEFPVESGGPTTLLNRMAWFVEPDADGTARIAKVWYPVFPPDQNASTVLNWLRKRAAVVVRPRTNADLGALRAQLTHHWGGTQIWSLGRAFDAERIASLVACIGPELVGIVTYDISPGGYQCEIVTLSSARPNTGAATLLLGAVEREARKSGCTRLFLTTTNDNADAIRFYQTRGWSLAALHKGNVDEARKRKPQIPLLGNHGIPVRDEVELELWIEEPVGSPR